MTTILVSVHGDSIARESLSRSLAYASHVAKHGYHVTFDNAVDLASEWTRGDLIDLLAWNDRNGCYTDADCDSEGISRLTYASAIDCLTGQTESAG